MRRYIRAPKLGEASYFFTLTLAERRGNDLLMRHIDALRQAFGAVRARHPFTIEAIVVLPDHLHALWRLPKEDDYTFALTIPAL
ncbi:transposase [Ottowia pentelensis]|uniref:Transposase n=1 Tax=Ottowia pentelensis TaxID=511108 RepID=A0ABV6PS85_9BURK